MFNRLRDLPEKTAASLPPGETALERSAGSPLPEDTLREARVLLVEDNPVNREVATAMLESFGCQVELRETGEQAAEAWEQGDFDLILMDGQMPVMDGYQATRLIREKEAASASCRHIPIVALTGHAQQEDRAKCLAAGMDDYLAKPFNTRQLRSIVGKWLPHGSRLRGEAVEAAQCAPVASGRPVPGCSPESRPEGSAAPGEEDSLVSAQFAENIHMLQLPGQPSLLDLIIDSYLCDTARLRESMRHGLAAGNLASVQRLAHTHKSSAGIVGALSLAELCKELESCCQADSAEEAAQLVEKIEERSQSVREVLTKIKRENANGCPS
ncbi:MAG TPA: response regulator [Geomonas sp.]|nr:response regulator [Geomonas sp.]